MICKFKQRVDYIVDQLAQCQNANANGYVGAIPDGQKAFAEIASGNIQPRGGFTLNGVWVPWYTMHKVMAGLFDSANLCGNAQAMDVLIKLTDWCNIEVKNLSDAQMQTMLDTEQGGMAETLANVYAVTGNSDYLKLARRFRHDRIFLPIADGKDILDGWHGNANIPKFIGYQRIYELTGDSQWGSAAQNFWNFVANDPVLFDRRTWAVRVFLSGEKISNLPCGLLTDPKHVIPITCLSLRRICLNSHPSLPTSIFTNVRFTTTFSVRKTRRRETSCITHPCRPARLEHSLPIRAISGVV